MITVMMIVTTTVAWVRFRIILFELKEQRQQCPLVVLSSLKKNIDRFVNGSAKYMVHARAVTVLINLISLTFSEKCSLDSTTDCKGTLTKQLVTVTCQSTTKDISGEGSLGGIIFRDGHSFETTFCFKYVLKLEPSPVI